MLDGRVVVDEHGHGNLVEPHDECVVASRFHAQKRTAEATLRERNPGAAKAIERFPSWIRNENPRAAGRLVQRQGARSTSPPYGAVAQSDRRIE